MAEESEFASQDVSAPEAQVAEASVAAAPVAAPVKQAKTGGRPFRVKLRGSVLVLVQLPNRRSVRAALHQLSTTGGVINLEKPLDEKIKVEMIFHIGGATVREKAEMLFPMWATQGWMQPFRFIEVSEADRAVLDAKLREYIEEPAKSAATSA